MCAGALGLVGLNSTGPVCAAECSRVLIFLTWATIVNGCCSSGL